MSAPSLNPNIRITGVPVRRKRFGYVSLGSGGTGTPTGTDFRHEHHLVMGVPVHRKRFGISPVGSGGAGPVVGKIPWVIYAGSIIQNPQ
jgi:hypothetical protein